MAAHFERGEPKFSEPSKFPGVRRELNFVLNERDLSGDVAAAVSAVDERIGSVSVLDVFRDAAKVGEGKKSVTFSFVIEDPEKTITDQEALEIQNRIVAEMEKRGLGLRGMENMV